MKSHTIKLSIIFALVLLFTPGLLFAQATNDIGGPYEVDDNTIFLMNFDNADNPWAILTGGEADTHGNPEIADYSARDGLGSSLRLDGEESWLQIQGTAGMDLQDDWTIEMWFRVETAGRNADMLWKPGTAPEFWEGNYWIEMRGDDVLEGGSHDSNVSSFDGLRNIASEPNTVEAGKWYHVTFIRDSEANMHYQIVRNEDLDLEWFIEREFNFTPRLQFTDLFLGHNSTDRWMHGYLDEIRISDIVREELLDVEVDSEPDFVSLSTVSNQWAGEETAVEIETEVNATFEGSIENVTLHYHNGSDWEEVAMNLYNGNTYQATIPAQNPLTIVRYYVSATTNDGVRDVYPANAEDESYVDYHAFAVQQEETTVLDLNFNEGSGNPADISDYSTPITLHGNPAFIEDAIHEDADDFFMEFDGEQDFLRAFSPHAGNNDEFTVDLWMRAGDWSDQFWHYLVQKPAIVPHFWGENTFEILTGAFDDPEPKITAGVWSEAEGNTRITLEDHVLEQGAWYRVILQVTNHGNGYELKVELRSSSNAHITEAKVSFEEPVSASHHPLRFAKGGGDRPYAEVAFNQIKVYNYSLEIPTSIDGNQPVSESPAQFELNANYPNPFNPSTVIPYTIANSDFVSLKVYDALGREVANLVNTHQAAGTYEVSFDASNLSSGVYFYRLEVSDQFTHTRRMMLIK